MKYARKLQKFSWSIAVTGDLVNSLVHLTTNPIFQAISHGLPQRLVDGDLNLTPASSTGRRPAIGIQTDYWTPE